MKHLQHPFTMLTLAFISTLFFACKKSTFDPPPAIAYNSTSKNIEHVQSSNLATTITNERVYLDLTQNQMVEGGLTPALFDYYVKQGYVLKSLSKDTYAKVGFKDKSGNVYYKVGWLRSGTSYLAQIKLEEKPKTILGTFLLKYCLNIWWPMENDLESWE